MARRFIRDKSGRFASHGTGMVSAPKPPRPKPKGGTMTRRLRAGVEQLKAADRSRDMALKGYAAGPIIYKTASRKAAASRPNPLAATIKPRSDRVSDALGASLRQLAQSDARYFRGIAEATKTKALKGQKPRAKRLKPGKP